MKPSDFSFELPESLIAQTPPKNRGDSRLLCLNVVTAGISDCLFTDLPSMLTPQDLLVFNDTRVIPARLFGHKATGGKVELLLERLLGEGVFLAQLKVSKAARSGSEITLEDGSVLVVLGREGDFYRLQAVDQDALLKTLEETGHMPLPPYIKRSDTSLDRDRYQTVFARRAGAVAAPTAGLHFSEAIMNVFKEKGIGMEYLTLHVGAGTFQPVRVDNIEEHQIHHEWYEIDESLCQAIEKTKKHGGRVIAVGTTSVRTLESAARSGALKPHEAETDIFIYPGFEFQIVDAMITNFHLPESTLLMLVSAFAGRETVLAAYYHAVREKYRFFSYGDAMFIVNKVQRSVFKVQSER